MQVKESLQCRFDLKRGYAAIGAFILAVTVPLFLSILLGDGTEYMKRLTSFLPEHRRELIMDAYDYYRDKEKTGLAVDYQAAKTALERLETQIDRRRETGKTEQNMGDQDLP